MRLIDGTIQPPLITNYILDRKDEIIDLLQKEDINSLFSVIMEYFDDQPTAYDAERVVEQLRENTMTMMPVIPAATVFDIVREGGAE